MPIRLKRGPVALRHAAALRWRLGFPRRPVRWNYRRCARSSFFLGAGCIIFAFEDCRRKIAGLNVGKGAPNICAHLTPFFVPRQHRDP